MAPAFVTVTTLPPLILTPLLPPVMAPPARLATLTAGDGDSAPASVAPFSDACSARAFRKRKQ
jgi:hypothetical protein